MQQHDNELASGYLKDSYEGIGREFSDVEVLHTSEVNVVAKAKRYGKWWLLKGLQGKVAGEVAYQQRLRKELEILTELQHPNIVSVVGLEKVGSLGECIVMEYVDGEPLSSSISNKKMVLEELLDAVAYCHRKGIVHRDLKPANIMITRNGGHVKMVDFGLADADSYAVLKQPAGTEGYISPEQRQTAVADIRNDIYSIGVIMQQMELGRFYNPIIKKCVAPIKSRYQRIEELQQAISRMQRARWIIGSVVCMFIIAALIVTAYMSMPHDEQIQLDEKHEVVEQKDELIEHREECKMDDVIANGKQYIDKQIAVNKMDKHIDTLSHILYLNEDIYTAIQLSGTSVDIFMKQQIQLSENEKAIVCSALNNYVGEVTGRWYKKIMKLKEDYVATFTAGDRDSIK